MNSKYKYFIDGERIYLRDVRLSDVNESYHKWLNDPEVNQFLETRFQNQSIDNIKIYVEHMYGKEDEIFLAICLKEHNKHIGNIKLGPINQHHRFADISLLIGEKDHWGKGLATEAIKLVVAFGFNILNLHRLSAGVYSNNTGSIKAFLKAGFTEEGTLREKRFYKETYIDEKLLGIISDK